MVLEITRELIGCTLGYIPELDVNERYPLGMKVIYKPTAYLFDRDTFLICRKDSEEAGYLCDAIPFPVVEQKEAMHAYIDSINNRSITNLFRHLSEENFGKVFWGVVDDGGERFCEYHRFEDLYRSRAVISWCGENNIPYYIKDSTLKQDLTRSNYMR